jgi:iron complex transport system ATP-binding protein
VAALKIAAVIIGSTGMSLAAIELALSRGNKEVVQGFSAALEKGELTAICGPNGVGKSTLLMALAGLIEPTAGMVLLDEKRLEKYTDQERAQTIGYLPQGADVAWDVSVENLVRLGRLPHRDRGDAAVEAAIAALDLEDLRIRPASQLSGGEKARALLARVLAGEPDWILADEPLAALDLAHQLSLLKHLRGAADAGAGVVIVLHDLTMAMNYADRVAVLSDDGDVGFAGSTLAADGPPQEALSEATVSSVWGVKARWIGGNGAKALVTK